MRKENLIEELERALTAVPLIDRLATEIKPVILEDSVSKNLEVIYQIATGRLSRLSYNMAWAGALKDNPDQKPKHTSVSDKHGLPVTFHDFDAISLQEVTALNNYFSQWLLSLAVRELSEFLNYYLLGLYETCLVIRHKDKKIKPADVVEMRMEYNSFEAGSLNERLKVLHDEFGIRVSHTQELASLYGLRNILAHFDGVVQKKFCDPKGEFRVRWPVNRYKLKDREKEKTKAYHRISKPFKGDTHGELEVTWLDSSKEKIYKIGDKILLEYGDMNGLIFFYLHVFNQLHRTLVQFVMSSGFRVKKFDDYMLKPTFFAITDEGKRIQLTLS